MVVAVAVACICTLRAYDKNTCSEKGSGITDRSHVLSGRVNVGRTVLSLCSSYSASPAEATLVAGGSPPSASVPFTSRPSSWTMPGQLDSPNASTIPS